MKEVLKQREHRVSLKEGRDKLAFMRKLLIITWLKIRSEDTLEGRKKWGQTYAGAVREEVEIIEDIIVPAKLGLKLPIRDLEQEEKVKKDAGQFAKDHGGSKQDGVDMVTRHINLVIKIQQRKRRRLSS